MVFGANGKLFLKRIQNIRTILTTIKVVLRLDTVVPNGYRDYPFEDAD
jgi:hypothetical protein